MGRGTSKAGSGSVKSNNNGQAAEQAIYNLPSNSSKKAIQQALDNAPDGTIIAYHHNSSNKTVIYEKLKLKTVTGKDMWQETEMDGIGIATGAISIADVVSGIKRTMGASGIAKGLPDSRKKPYNDVLKKYRTK